MGIPKFLKVASLATHETGKISGNGSKKTFSGYNVQFTDLLSHYFGFSYELLAPADNAVGKRLPDGNWTGMIGMVLRGEADIVAGRLVITEERSKVVSYSYPFTAIEISFVAGKQEDAPDMATFLKPFSVQLWVSVLLCLLFMPCIFYTISNSKMALRKHFWNICATFLGKSTFNCPETLSEYLLISSWIIGIISLTYSYSALLLSFIIFPPQTGVRTIPELAVAVTKGTYRCLCSPGSFIPGALLNSDENSFRIVGESLQQNEGMLDIEVALKDQTSSRKKAVLGERRDFLYLKDSYFISNDVFLNMPPAIVMSKNFCCNT